MHVDQHVLGAGDLAQRLVDGHERRAARLHEQVARQVDHPERAAVALDRAGAAAGLAAEVVGRAHDRAALVEVGPELAVAVGVVAEGDHVHPGGEQLVRVLGGDADPARGVLAVGHHPVERELLAERGEQRPERAAPGRGHDIADEQDGGHERGS